MLYAALGDSITYGYSTTDPEFRFASRIERHFATGQRVHLYLHAKPGWTSTKLAKSLSKVPDVIWGEAKLTTLLVGGNDLLKAAPWLLGGDSKKILTIADTFHRNLLSIAQTVKKGDGAILLGTIYNPFPRSLIAWEYIAQMNEAVRAVASEEQLHVVDLCNLFKGEENRYIEGYKVGELRDLKWFKNPIHPNNRGHEAIARAFVAAYQDILRKRRTGRPQKSKGRPRGNRTRTTTTQRKES